MDKRIAQFYEAIGREMAVTLATAAEGRVTMRLVSPVCWQKDILIFTRGDSLKYRQLKASPYCCVAAGGFYAEAKAAFLGATLLEKNQAYREAYAKKFPGAFDEGVAFGGRDAEFILLTPTRLTGWTFENDEPAQGGVPTAPFELTL